MIIVAKLIIDKLYFLQSFNFSGGNTQRNIVFERDLMDTSAVMNQMASVGVIKIWDVSYD